MTLRKPHVCLNKPQIPQARQLRLQPSDECQDCFLITLTNALLKHNRDARPRTAPDIIDAIDEYLAYQEDPGRKEAFVCALERLGLLSPDILSVLPHEAAEDESSETLQKDGPGSYKQALQDYTVIQITHALRFVQEKHQISHMPTEQIVNLVQRPGMAENIDSSFPWPLPGEVILTTLRKMIDTGDLAEEDDEVDFSNIS